MDVIKNICAYKSIYDKKINSTISIENELSNQAAENEIKNAPDIIHKFKTKIKQLEAHIKQQNEELTNIVNENRKFISVLAHDLRSPFNSILSSLEIIKQELNSSHLNGFSMYIDNTINSTNTALSLLDNLLIWIISQRNVDNIKLESINLQDLFSKIILDTNDSLTKKNIRINQYIGDDIVITADLQMVKSILRNLISNAIKFSRNYGEITVSAIAMDKNVEIAIEDNGIGISLEAQKQLFKINSFHSTLGTNNEKGTGLGLLICKEFVELHGGNIWLESEQGKRSLVKFSLPQ